MFVILDRGTLLQVSLPHPDRGLQLPSDTFTISIRKERRVECVRRPPLGGRGGAVYCRILLLHTGEWSVEADDLCTTGFSFFVEFSAHRVDSSPAHRLITRSRSCLCDAHRIFPGSYRELDVPMHSHRQACLFCHWLRNRCGLVRPYIRSLPGTNSSHRAHRLTVLKTCCKV